MKTDYSDIELLKNADWIGIDRRFCRSVVMFHYKFHCENTEITGAKMIIACTGSYRILINHRPVNGDTIEINFETSGVQAFKYDIADFLKSENAMSVQVAGKMKLSETPAALDKYALIAVIAVIPVNRYDISLVSGIIHILCEISTVSCATAVLIGFIYSAVLADYHAVALTDEGII